MALDLRSVATDVVFLATPKWAKLHQIEQAGWPYYMYRHITNRCSRTSMALAAPAAMVGVPCARVSLSSRAHTTLFLRVWSKSGLRQACRCVLLTLGRLVCVRASFLSCPWPCRWSGRYDCRRGATCLLASRPGREVRHPLESRTVPCSASPERCWMMHAGYICLFIYCYICPAKKPV